MDYLSDIEQYKDFDNFFYYGFNNLEIETKSDIFQNLMQSKRSLFYDRAYDSAGIPQYENRPNSLVIHINLPYDIVVSLAKRNQYVSDGSIEGKPDRRIALSQSTIKIEIANDKVNVNVLYIPLADYRQTDLITTAFNIKV
jgi:hypothetical protein